MVDGRWLSHGRQPCPKGNLAELLRKPAKAAKGDNQPALSIGDVARWWADVARREGMAAQALRFVTLTAARSGEASGMTWEEIDSGAANKAGEADAAPVVTLASSATQGAVWTVPAVRMARPIPALHHPGGLCPPRPDGFSGPARTCCRRQSRVSVSSAEVPLPGASGLPGLFWLHDCLDLDLFVGAGLARNSARSNFGFIENIVIWHLRLTELGALRHLTYIGSTAPDCKAMSERSRVSTALLP